MWHTAKYGDPYSEFVLFIYPSKCAHTSVNTHTHPENSGQPFYAAAPGCQESRPGVLRPHSFRSGSSRPHSSRSSQRGEGPPTQLPKRRCPPLQASRQSPLQSPLRYGSQWSPRQSPRQSPLCPRSPQSLLWSAPLESAPPEAVILPPHSRRRKRRRRRAHTAPEAAVSAPTGELTEFAPDPAPFQELTESAPEPAPFREQTETAPESAPEPALLREPTESAPEPAPLREPTESAPEPAPEPALPREPTESALERPPPRVRAPRGGHSTAPLSSTEEEKSSLGPTWPGGIPEPSAGQEALPAPPKHLALPVPPKRLTLPMPPEVLTLLAPPKRLALPKLLAPVLLGPPWLPAKQPAQPWPPDWLDPPWSAPPAPPRPPALGPPPWYPWLPFPRGVSFTTWA